MLHCPNFTLCYAFFFNGLYHAIYMAHLLIIIRFIFEEFKMNIIVIDPI